MADGQPRTSYQIAAALYGVKHLPRQWWRVALACERLAASGALRDLGKMQHRTVYVMGAV
jgi:hypothetical protein